MFGLQARGAVDLDRAVPAETLVGTSVVEDLPVGLGLAGRRWEVVDSPAGRGAGTSGSRRRVRGRCSGRVRRRVRIWSRSGREAMNRANAVPLNAALLSVTSLAGWVSPVAGSARAPGRGRPVRRSAVGARSLHQPVDLAVPPRRPVRGVLRRRLARAVRRPGPATGPSAGSPRRLWRASGCRSGAGCRSAW